MYVRFYRVFYSFYEKGLNNSSRIVFGVSYDNYMVTYTKGIYKLRPL